MKTRTFYPSRFWGFLLFAVALFFGALQLGLIWLGTIPSSPEFPQAGSMGPAFVLGIMWIPMIVFFLDVSIGIFRSRAILTDEGLDLTTTRFRIWRIRRVHRVKLAWNEDYGVQFWEQTNAIPHAVSQVQTDVIVHTAKGKFCVTNKIWPQYREFAEAVSQRIGRPINDIQEGVELVRADRPRDRIGLRILHGFGIVGMVAGSLLLLLACISLFGGNSLKDAGVVAMLGGTLISMGAMLRRYWMQGMK